MRSTVTRNPAKSQASESLPPELRGVAAALREEFDATFRFHDAATGDPIVAPEPDEILSSYSPEDCRAALEVAGEETPKVVSLPGGRFLIGFPLASLGSPQLVALGVVPALAGARAEAAREQARLERWSRAVLDRLVAARASVDSPRSPAEPDQQSMIAWEAMMGLDRLHRAAKIHRDPVRERARVLRIAGELLGAQMLAWVPASRDDEVVTEGERLLSPWDCGQLTGVLAGQPLWEETGYLVFNDDEKPWGDRFPRVKSLLAIPVAEKKLIGWVIAINKVTRPGRGAVGREVRPPHFVARGETGPAAASILPFRRTDAALLMPFASMLSLHSRASQRYQYIKELLVGLTRSLTAAIDAKDAYTYGHSERVARAAVEIGRALGLREDELSDIYLTGLLHDIGKIGIRDDVLTKRGPLTDDEFKHIQQHVVIGHRILADLHAISHLLPGVLYHHERFDGGGYPEGLKGETIPMLARILAVADSFDAMNTSRPYRTAMAPERVDEILRQGAGTQWDPQVIDAYVRCRDRLTAIRQRGIGESLRDALDGALRRGTGGKEFASVEMSLVEQPRRIV